MSCNKFSRAFLLAIIVWCLPLKSLQAKDMEDYIRSKGYSTCANVQVISVRGDKSQLRVQIVNEGSDSQKGILLAGFRNTMTGKIGFASGYTQFYLSPGEKEYLDISVDRPPIISKNIDAIAYCP